MYIYEPILKQYYEILDISAFEEYLNIMSLENIKTLFKSTYLEQLLNDTYDQLIRLGQIPDDGEHIDMKDTVSFFKNYLLEKYGEDIYKIVIRNFEANFDYNLINMADKSRLN